MSETQPEKTPPDIEIDPERAKIVTRGNLPTDIILGMIKKLLGEDPKMTWREATRRLSGQRIEKEEKKSG